MRKQKKDWLIFYVGDNMTRFLTIIRRIFWAGTISLILILTLLDVNLNQIIAFAIEHNNIQDYFSIFFLMSPLLFVLFTVISSAYIRRNGQLAAFHQTQSPVTTFFRCWGHDIIAPFKNIGNFFRALFGKNIIGRGVLIFRFIGMIILIFVCLVGMGYLMV